MKNIISVLTANALLLAVNAAAVASDENAFSFGGFALQQTLVDLKKSFPLSRIEQSAVSKSVWVSVDSREIRDQVTSAHYDRQGQNFLRLHLSFERPASPGKSDDFYDDHSGRLPPCKAILSLLEKNFGKPAGPHQTTNDTDVTSDNYVWEKPGEKLILVCGRRLSSQSGLTWASGLTIGPGKNDSCRNTPYWCPGS